MTTVVLTVFLSNMELFVSESGFRRLATDYKIESKQCRSITQIRKLFLRSLTVATLQTRPPATTTDSVTDHVLLQGWRTRDNDVRIDLCKARASAASKKSVTACPEVKVNEGGDLNPIKSVQPTHVLSTHRQWVDVSYDEVSGTIRKIATIKKKGSTRPIKWLRRRGQVDFYPLVILTGSKFPTPTISTRRQFDEWVLDTKPVKVALMLYVITIAILPMSFQSPRWRSLGSGNIYHCRGKNEVVTNPW